MGGAQWFLELVLLALLAVTLFHAMRLERALGVLKRDRAVLEDLVAGFNESTRQAESGIERLRASADGAGRTIARQIEQAQRLRDDLAFLSERGEKLAERLEGSVRTARLMPDPPLLGADRMADVPRAGATVAESMDALRMLAARLPDQEAGPEDRPRLRSQAERDLLRALKANR